MGIVWVPLTIKGVLCHWESRGVITEIELSPSPILAAMDFSITPPKFNSEFTPEKCWLEDDPFLLGPGNFSGASC